MHLILQASRQQQLDKVQAVLLLLLLRVGSRQGCYGQGVTVQAAARLLCRGLGRRLRTLQCSKQQQQQQVANTDIKAAAAGLQQRRLDLSSSSSSRMVLASTLLISRLRCCLLL
jgi:hypothetical protein